MNFAGELRAWLLWVIKIRFVIITLTFAIECAVRQFIPSPGNLLSIKHLGIAVILWYLLGLFYLVYYQLSRDYLLQAHLQLYSDIVIITAIVHFTGDAESSYISLYLVVIILASILLRRAQAFGVAAVSFIAMGSLLEFAYLPGIYGSLGRHYPNLRFLATSSPVPMDLGTLQVKIVFGLCGFFAVAYLSSYLAENLREAGAELRDKNGQVASLQAITENIIHSLRSGLITTDLAGTITELNPAGAAILGRDAAELKGTNIATVFPIAEAGPIAERGPIAEVGTVGPVGTVAPPEMPGVGPEDLHATGSSIPMTRREFAYRRPGGEERTLGVSASPLIVPGRGTVGAIYNFQDLTEEKRRESEYRAKDRMATLGRLSAAIAHEIRNPLASIAGSVKLLESLADLDEDQAKLIAIVSRESDRLNKLISDFLCYSRPQRFEFRDVDLVNLLEETLLLLEHHPSFGPSCRVEKRFPPHSVLARVDADKLRQVFWNICDNALKAMPEGGTLTAALEEPSANGTKPQRARCVRVSLQDTGVGLTREQLEKLFEPFQSGFTNGTGLGLAIVYQVVEGHGGHVRVESEPGKGSRFVIDLPRVANPWQPLQRV
jgi:two-component system sensor histidine kinase PilS (NtrC family)